MMTRFVTITLAALFALSSTACAQGDGKEMQEVQVAVMNTNMGTIAFRLYPEAAPKACENLEKLAETRGVFPAWKESIWGPDKTCARRDDGSRIRPMRKLRNSNLTTIAPTGTISIFAGYHRSSRHGH